MERDQFLQRVRTASATSGLQPAAGEAPGGLVPDLSVDDLTARFIERLEMVDASSHMVSDGEAATRAVVDLMAAYGATEYLSWDPDQLPVAGLLDRLPGRRVSGEIAADVAARLGHQTGYMDLQVGITGADAGLAESGSIVLAAGPGRPRMASAIPLAHIALLRAGDIVPTLSHWVDEHPLAAAGTSNLVVITGPSRTADIEQVLNLGVHGPKHLHVVVVPGS